MCVTQGIQSYSSPNTTGFYNDYNLKFSKIPSPTSRLVRDVEYPLVLELSYSSGSGIEPLEKNDTLYDAIAAFVFDLSKNHDYFKTLIRKHAALVIKGFGSTDLEQYSKIFHKFAEGSEMVEYEQNGVAHPRKNMAKNINGANRTSNKRRLYAHQEFSSFKYYPSFISFFAKVPSETGGDETITHATELFDAVNAKYPEFIKETAEKGIYLTQSWPYDQDLGGEIFSWKDTHSFGKLIQPGDDLETQKRKAGQICEERAAEKFEFTADNSLKLHEYTQPVRIHPYTKKPIFFSSLPAYYQKYKAGLEKDEPVELTITYGSGDLIPFEYLDFLLDQSIKLCFEHKFEPGDILYIDNYQSYHGRTAYGTQYRDVLESFLDDIPTNKKFPGYMKEGSI